MTRDTSEIGKSALIRSLNDNLRTQGEGGQVVAVGQLAHEDETLRQTILAAVRQQQIVTGGDDDPYREHDFGSLTVAGRKVIWKIDFYDRKYQYASEAPEDEELTLRVLSIMFASDY